MAPPALLLLLLGCFSCGRAQLTFNRTDPATKTVCSRSVLLPCFVNNLKYNNASLMVVEWSFKNEPIYIYDPAAPPLHIKKSSAFDSAALDLGALPRGDASLRVGSASQATPGAYTCNVTEGDRAGIITAELKDQWLLLEEKGNALIVLLVVLPVGCFWMHLLIAARASLEKPDCYYIIRGAVPAVCGLAGLLLFFLHTGCSMYLAGLGVAVFLPLLAVALFQYFLFPKSVHTNRTRIALIVIKVTVVLIAAVGFGLCASVYPSAMGWFLVCGIALFTFCVIVDLSCAAVQFRTWKRGKSASSAGDGPY